MTVTATELEDTVRREALARYLEGEEEQALDLLAVARAIADPATHESKGGESPPSIPEPTASGRVVDKADLTARRDGSRQDWPRMLAHSRHR